MGQLPTFAQLKVETEVETFFDNPLSVPCISSWVNWAATACKCLTTWGFSIRSNLHPASPRSTQHEYLVSFRRAGGTVDAAG